MLSQKAIKCNISSRVAFKVNTCIESNTILGHKGAQQLLNDNDMFFTDGTKLMRVRGAFIDQSEVIRICEYISQQTECTDFYELPKADSITNESSGIQKNANITHFDPLFKDVARFIVLNQSCSTSVIQRKFQVGYSRAGLLMEQLEKARIISTTTGNKHCKVMIQDEKSLINLLSSITR